jgi:hypothetical protein
MDATINAAYYGSKMDQEAKANAVEDAYLNGQMDQDDTMAAIDAQLGIHQGRNETSCVIKGNISNTGEKIYHLPGQRFYDETTIDTSKGERWFVPNRQQ